VDLFALRVYMAWGPGRGRRLRLAGPPGLRAALVGFAGEDGWDEAFAFEELAGDDGALELAGGLALRYARVPHLSPTYALRLDGGGRSVCYSADCAENDALPRLAEGAGLLVAECSFGAEPVPDGVPHLGGREAGRTAARAGVGRLLLTHCYPEFDRDAALAAARGEFGGDVDWARQGEAVPA
jgi:ribonuclease BN (tRNA processing enzyme)